ncbi:MAG TPA: DMT family transporter [Spirochaetota bacterium]|jgi:drug/metabolite transporter (DMT)-like permease|nr:DMT family transporter [Spirochaetota bacterium]OQA98789.1 MAG: O-acetylserine/cysteine export protein [Spirochaetes bacterium ADurb.Bin218]HOK03224.1 DMT family transporter [Spirochaetota bacterium]HOK93526.1 DMT family transporter [Spirochaetota bacterium]HON15378.1 DMT family transporter [Spirochaetota bacterium]
MKSQFKAKIALLVAMIIWSTSFVALKISFRSYDPMFVIWARQIIAATAFLFVIKKLWKSCTYQKGDLKLLLLMSLFEPCLYFIFEAMALVNTSASQAGMLTSMLPLLVAIAAFFVLKEKTTSLTWIGFVTAITGAVILSGFSTATEEAPNPMLGNFLEFMAMVCATGYTITLKKLSSRYNPFFLTAIQCFVGTFFFFPLIFIGSKGFPGSFEPFPALSIIYLGLIVTIGAYGLYSLGISKVKASTAAAFVNLIPVFTLFWGWLLLNETMNAFQYMGCGLVFIGVYISQKG